MPAAARSRLPTIVAVSVGLHVALLALLLSIPQTRRAIVHMLPVEVVEQKPPPPPPRPRPRPRPRIVRHALVVHRSLPQPRIAPAPAGPGSGTAGFGVPTHNGPGTLAVPVGRSLAPPATGPVPLELDLTDDATGSGLDRMPTPIGPLRANFPEVARLADLSGQAVVEGYVGPDGRVSHVRLLSTTSPVFGPPAIEALGQTRFHPALRAGVPVGCSIRLPITFSLDAVAAAAPIPAASASEPPATGSADR